MRRPIFAVLPKICALLLSAKANFYRRSRVNFDDMYILAIETNRTLAGGAVHWTGTKRGRAMARPALFFVTRRHARRCKRCRCAQPLNIVAAALVGGQEQPPKIENPWEVGIFELPFKARWPRPVLNGELTRGLPLNRRDRDRLTRLARSRLCGKPADAALLRSVC